MNRTFARWAAAVVLVAAAVPATAYAATTSVEPPEVTTPATQYVVGTPVTFTLSPGGATTPARYRYVINHGRTRSVKAVAGTASISLTPVRRTTFLSVAAVADDGTVSPSVDRILLATAAAPAAEKDLNGDGVPDLLTVGGTAGLPPGLWLAPGATKGGVATGNGKVRTPATDIGANGNGVSGNGAEDFTGSQAVTGHFTGEGFQDALVYYPTGDFAGGAVILVGSGDGSVLQSQISGNTFTLPQGILTDLNGNNPLQVANAYNASGSGVAYADLIGISGDPVNGFYLVYYPNSNGTGAYIVPVRLDTPTPTGGADWDAWTIATTELPSGTAMYLWHRTTGQLYLWQGVRFTDSGDLTGTLAYTPYLVASSWNAGVPLSTVETADLDADGVPDLWAVTPAGVVTAYLVSNLSTTQPARVRAKQPQSLLP